MIEVVIEAEAWTGALPDAEAVALAAAEAAFTLPPRGGESRSPEASDRTGRVGGEALDDAGQAQGAMHLSFPTADATANTPIPNPSPLEGQGSISILLTDDEAVADLNHRFRGKAGPTNVLSFPAPANPQDHLGDIALAFGVCAREAAEQGKTLGQHLSHLTVHGVLHLLGYDHESDGEAEAMEAHERVVLETLGVPDPYAAERG